MKHTTFFMLCTALLMHFNSFGISSSQITITNGTGPKFIIGNTCADGPQAAYLVVNIGNTSSTDTLASVSVKLTKITSATSGFKLLAPTADSTILISRILPSGSEGAYFYIQYPCVDGATVKFNYEISDTASGVVQDSVTITVNSIQAAGAGGDILSQKIVGLDALGILVADTVTYEFGNYNGGEIIFQPNGDTAFKANGLQLIGSKIVSSAFNGCGVTTNLTNTYYFNNGSGCGAGSGNVVKVVFYYINSLFNDTTFFFPYAAMKSGSPLKYSSNYTAQTASFGTTQNSNTVSMTKTASCGICDANDTVTYTVTISNSASDTIMIDQVTDVLPSGYSFIGFDPSSDINNSNTSVEPANGATGTISFVGKIPSSTFPYRSYIISQSSSITLKYKVKVKSTTSSDLDTNNAIASVGSFYLDTAFAVTCAGCPSLPVSLVSFEAQNTREGIALKWLTASETNNSHFMIYSKTDNGAWKYLARVEGAGQSTGLLEYNIVDPNNRTAARSIIYRLEQVDFDGTATSYFTKINLAKTEVKLAELYPNPVGDYFNLNISGQVEEWTVKIIDGRGVTQQTLSSAERPDMKYVPVGIEKLASGMYTVLFIADGQADTFTIWKR